MFLLVYLLALCNVSGLLLRRHLADKMLLYGTVGLFSKKTVGRLVADFCKDTHASVRVTLLPDRLFYHYNERRKTLNIPPDALQSTDIKSIGVALQKASTALYQRKMPVFAYRIVNLVDVHTHLLTYHGYLAAAATFLVWGWSGYALPTLALFYVSCYLLVIVATLIKAIYDMKASAEALHWLESKSCATRREHFMIRDAMYSHIFDHLTTSMGSIVFVFLEYASVVFFRKRLFLR